MEKGNHSRIESKPTFLKFQLLLFGSANLPKFAESTVTPVNSDCSLKGVE